MSAGERSVYFKLHKGIPAVLATALLTLLCLFRVNEALGQGLGPSGSTQITYTISACIDGRDLLIIHGGTLQWEHLDFAPVGNNGNCTADETTSIVVTNNGTQTLSTNWQPTFPNPANVPSGTLSSTFSNLAPALPPNSQVDLTVIQARESLTIYQRPSAANNWTLILDFNDDAFGGAAVYTAQVTFSVPSIQTYAGGATCQGMSGVTDAIAADAVALDSSGNLFIADSNHDVICRLDGTTGKLTTVAGNGTYGSSGDGGQATAATLSSPTGVAVDAAGNLYIADYFNNKIRRVDATTGIITTVAGNGTSGYGGDGGPATAAQLSDPHGVAVDRVGNLFIADSNNNLIRRVDTASGIITTVAGNGASGYSGDGGPATAAQLSDPSGIAIDAAGDLYISDLDNNSIRRVDATSGIITTVAGNGTYGYSGDGGPARSALLALPEGVSVDSAGNLYIADYANNRIRRVDATTGIISTVAGNGTSGFSGDGGPATAAQLSNPTGAVVDAAGSLYIADSANLRTRRVDATTGIISTVAGNGTGAFSGDGEPATAAQLFAPAAVAVDAAGDLYVLDLDNNRIRRVDAATGLITTVAGNGGFGYTGDGGPATAAQLYDPRGIAVDAPGNLYIADFNNCVVRRVDATTGIITTVAGNGNYGYSGDGGPATAASLSVPTGVAVDAAGDLFIADEQNNRIRRVDATTGIITTVAGNGNSGYGGDGGQATAALLASPTGVAADAAGNLYIADQNNDRIRRVDVTTGTITTVAGNGTSGYSGDGGQATAAQLDSPFAVAVDQGETLYIADTNNNLIRRVDTTGIITTVAGNGTYGYSGDGGPATSAELAGPTGVAAVGNGTFFIADTGNNRVRGVVLPLGLISPPSGAVITAGQGVTVQWTGGGPTVNLALIDNVAFAVVAGVGSFANTGTTTWTFPTSLGFGGPCGRTYLFYISSGSGSVYGFNYAYGPTFTVVCNNVPPAITPTVTGTLGNNGWYTSNVSVTWSVTSQSTITSETGCGPLTISTDTAGQTITCSATSSGGGTSSQSVTIKRDAAAPATIATPAPLPNANGWNDTNVTVSFSGTDATSGIASCSPNVVLNAQGANQSASGTCTDNAGNVSVPATVSGIDIEFSAPVETDSFSVQPNPSGWFNAPVTISFIGTDLLSGMAPNGCTSPITLSTNGSGQSVTGFCTNRAGDSTSLTVSGINIDTTPPVATATPVPPPNANGWNNSTVTVSFSGTDSLNGSGIASCSPNVVISTQGANQIISGTCTDVAGNVSAPATDTVKIDETPPVVWIFSPVPNDGFVIGEAPTASYSCSDALSGVATCTGPVANGAAINTANLGNASFSVTATDLAGNTATVSDLYKINPAGTVIITTRAGDGAPGYGGDGAPATVAQLFLPVGVAVDSAGNLYFGDAANARVRRVTPGGIISTVVGNGTQGYSGDGGPATAAELRNPLGVAVDSAGNLYIADSQNYRVRLVTPGGTISTVAGNGSSGYSGDGGPATAAQFGYVEGVAVDSAGNLYLADSNGNRIRRVTPGGTISTVAGNGTQGYSGDGGPATAAELYFPTGVAVDSAGNLYIADDGNSRIRRVTPGGTISTVAGNGVRGYSGDGGAATAAELNSPYGVAVDSAGNLYIADSQNFRVRLVTPGGTISTIAGNGTQGYGGDGGPATSGELNNAVMLTVDTAGILYVGDQSNDRVRRVRDTTYTFAPELFFGSQAVGTTSLQQVVTLTNRGVSPVTIASIALGGTTAGQFKIVPSVPSGYIICPGVPNGGGSIPAGGHCSVAVEFAPTSAGAKSAVLTVNGPVTKSVSLFGTGGGTYQLNPASISFGNQALGTTSATVPVTLTNTGTIALTISSISISNQFSQTNNCGNSLAVGSSCTISVVFAPTVASGAGVKSGLLTVNTSGGTGNSVTATGTGVAPTYSLSPTSLSFGSQALNLTTAAQTITVKNTGTVALPITSIKTAPPFSQANTCGSSLPAASSCAISVSFTPTAGGTASGTLTVTAGGGATNPPPLPLSGTGVVSTYAPLPASLSFTQLHGTTSAPQIVTLTNTGTVVLPITSIAITAGTPFSQTNNCPSSLGPGTLCQISVVFSPAAAAKYTSTLTLTLGGGAAIGKVTLKGTGT